MVDLMLNNDTNYKTMLHYTINKNTHTLTTNVDIQALPSSKEWISSLFYLTQGGQIGFYQNASNLCCYTQITGIVPIYIFSL